MDIRVVVTENDFSLDVEIDRIRKQSKKIGAIASFVGLVRDINEDEGVSSLFLEHYPGMTEKSLTQILEEAEKRWELMASTIIHRVGRLHPSDRIVLVIIASQHRKHALNACDFVMDYLKTRAPFWKKEKTQAGEKWLSSRDSDLAAARKWNA